ncbi:hypothetical protein V8E54_004167 [Elaphomyces granulatus]
MLWKLSVEMFEKLVAGIGAIITIIAMVLDPFFQQVITIEFKPSRVGDVFISSTEFVIDMKARLHKIFPQHEKTFDGLNLLPCEDFPVPSVALKEKISDPITVQFREAFTNEGEHSPKVGLAFALYPRVYFTNEEALSTHGQQRTSGCRGLGHRSTDLCRPKNVAETRKMHAIASSEAMDGPSSDEEGKEVPPV